MCGFDYSQPFANSGSGGGPDGSTVAGYGVSGISIDSTVTRWGTGSSLKIAAVSAAKNAWGLPCAGSTGYFRMWIRFSAFPVTNTRAFLGNDGSSGAAFTPFRVSIRSDGKMVLTVSNTTEFTSVFGCDLAGTAFSLNTWYLLEIYCNNSVAITRVRVNGVEITNLVCGTSSSGGASNCFAGALDTVADTFTFFLDDFIYDDATADNVWPVSPNVRCGLVIPASDAHVGSWTGGGGGTTNLFDGINNLPPTGSATLSNANQIMSVDTTGNNSTDEYICNMQTYLAAGITGVINAVRTAIVHGETASAGTKTGTVEIRTNPTDATVRTFTFGNDSGAQGTYPTGWSSGAISPYTSTTASPALTSAATMALRKTDAGSRNATVCFLGLVVEYDPTLPTQPYVLPSQAVQRAANW